MAFPTPDIHVLIWVALVPLLVASRGATRWQCWWLGLLTGFTWRIGTLYWISHVMGNYGDFPTLVAYAITALLALWMALNTGLVWMLVPSALRWGPGGAVALAAAWVSLEYLQTLLPFGFPWSLVGYAAGGSPLLLQGADLAGVWGLSFVAVFTNGALAIWIMSGRQAWRGPAVAASMIAGLAIYGAVELAAAPEPAAAVAGETAGEPLRVAAVQGNVEQGRVWAPGALAPILERHVSLTRQAGDAGAELVLWPESSVPIPGGLPRDPATRRVLGELASRQRSTIVVGSPFYEVTDEGAAVTNAAFLITGDGRWTHRYDKVHLVPFGEYVPLGSWLFRFVGPLVEAVAGFRHGEADQGLFADEAGGVPLFAMAICYEVVFPDHLRRQVARGATFLTTITNDAWFGETSAPYQHFEMARFRAVETRRYLVRAANTGISGVIDPWGRVLQSSALNREALLIADIEPRHGRSPYVVWGDLLPRLCVVLWIVAIVLGIRDARPPAPGAVFESDRLPRREQRETDD